VNKLPKLYADRHEKILVRPEASAEIAWALPWVGSEVAKTWPEGSAVLSRPAGAPLSAKKMDYRTAQLHQWFRPDWVGNPQGYGPEPREYMMLESAL